MNQVLNTDGPAWNIPTADLRTQVQDKLARQDDEKTNYDAIVVGVGSMGSAACYHLARQGYNVLGLEQFDIPHELGSHGGQSRIIRKAYFEHPNYVPLLEKAYANWKSLEKESGMQLYFKTGLLYFGPEDNLLIQGTRKSAIEHDVEVTEFSSGDQREQFPQFSIPSTYTNLLEPDAGLIPPERAILIHTKQALNHGAVIRSREKTLDWSQQNSAITVKTDRQTYQCKKLILATGAWAPTLTPLSNLRVTRQVIAWAEPKRREKFELEKFPCWTVADPAVSGFYYGFPILPSAFGAPVGLKFAHHTTGELTDPDAVNRSVSKIEKETLVAAVKKFVPEGIDAVLDMKTCLYTSSPDDHFILDNHPESEDVVIAAGFSGHGFKFASAIGEILTELAMDGKTSQPIDFLRLVRLG